jgi:hypothetical protein
MYIKIKRKEIIMKQILLYIITFFNISFLSAQEFVLPNKINFYNDFMLTNENYILPDVRIWGWSNNGKVAYSVESKWADNYNEIKCINFYILDTIYDKIIFELNIDPDSFDLKEEALYNLFKPNIMKALIINNIIEQEIQYYKFPIRKNNSLYNGQIINKYKKDLDYNLNFVESYKVLIALNDKSKIVSSFIPVDNRTYEIFTLGYLLSPFENRALVIIVEKSIGFEGTTALNYRFTGCHLSTGFD